MNNESFIERIKMYVRDVAIEDVILNLNKPPGRKPRQRHVIQSQWFNNLCSNDQNILKEIIQEAIDEAIFGFLATLDGVRIIEDNDEQKGEFKLTYTLGDKKERLNDPDKEYLHDIYNSLTNPE
ncbi:hypothetical protein CVD25_20325 [Bacillus canaveralius]|uniref:Uncharacterized protein n=1 Tax=Bacillus canaveralius TaxID=1403243 RepID=A0A2N5GJL2_9BACI|nr:hypothetical protein [Bacillus canaveralius]PLR81426.1 hypothetical protein CU635_15200 [Bacillus canaveralius]PLR90035.1 hypothetical protein CVD25_20325 [Bacillus canaveralius]